MWYVLAILFSTSVLAAQKKDNSPPSGIVHDTKELATTHFTCSFKNNNKNVIVCEFLSVSLSMPTPKEIAEKLAENDEEFEEGKKEISKEFTEFKKKVCVKQATEELDNSKRALQTNNYAHVLVPAMERALHYWQQLCACSDKTCFLDVFKVGMRDQAKLKAESCQVSAQKWKTEFQRDGDGWISIEPGALCYSITTTLSPARDSKDYKFWNMRTVRVPKPDAATSTSCTIGGKVKIKLDDTTDSWHGYGDVIPLTCKSVQLSAY